MYVKKTYRFRDAVEVEEYHDFRHYPGGKREKKRRPTPEDVARVNQWRKERTCRHKIRRYFKEGDIYATLTYRQENRPQDMEQAKKDFGAFIRKLKREFKKDGRELFWIRNIEVGTRNGWHVHLLVPDLPGIHKTLDRLWTGGRVMVQLIQGGGRIARLAAYMTKTPRTDPRLRESNYSASRNMPLPPPERKIMHRRTWQAPRIRKGWQLEQDTLREGINPVTGYPYRCYTILRI